MIGNSGPVRCLLHHRGELSNYPRVEFPACLLTDVADRPVSRPGGTVRTVAGQRIEHVDHREQPGSQGDLLAGEPVLLKSVQLRNPYIDPLNYLQVEMLRRLRSGTLDRESEAAARAVVELTINGISGGLKNTG